MRTLVAIWRILRVIGMVVQGLWLTLLVMPRCDAAAWHAIMQRWAVQLLRCLGVTVRVSGQPQPGAVLMVANHVSWLDIPALHASSPRTRFVSKSAIAHSGRFSERMATRSPALSPSRRRPVAK